MQEVLIATGPANRASLLVKPCSCEERGITVNMFIIVKYVSLVPNKTLLFICSQAEVFLNLYKRNLYSQLNYCK